MVARFGRFRELVQYRFADDLLFKLQYNAPAFARAQVRHFFGKFEPETTSATDKTLFCCRMTSKYILWGRVFEYLRKRRSGRRKYPHNEVLLERDNAGIQGASFPGKLFWKFLLIKMENKMQNRLIALGLLAGLIGAGSAHADVGVEAGVGTTGVGLHLSVPLLTSLNARIGANALNYSFNGSTSDLNYDFKLKLQTADALLDWFPFNGAFRISAGAVYNGNKIDAKSKPNSNGTYIVNGQTYPAATAGTLNGHTDFRKTVPYLGIGWGNSVAKDKGWGFSTDLGAIFQGSAKTTLTNDGCTASASQCAQLAAAVAAENAKLNDKADKLRTYPVIRVAVTYKF